MYLNLFSSSDLNWMELVRIISNELSLCVTMLLLLLLVVVSVKIETPEAACGSQMFLYVQSQLQLSPAAVLSHFLANENSNTNYKDHAMS